MSEGLFNTFCREHRLLSNELERRASTEFADLQEAATTADLDAFRPERVSERINRLPEAPSLTTMQALPVGNAGWRKVDASVSVPIARHAVKVEVRGDARLLEYWPDKESSELRPVDLDVVHELGGEGALAEGLGKEETARYWDAKQTWRYVRTPGSPNETPTAIVTHLDLTREEERAAAGTDLIRDAFVERRRRIEPIVAAIARQTERYHKVDLPERIAEIVRLKREEFEDREAVTNSLTFPPEWSAAEPTLDPESFMEGEATDGSAGVPSRDSQSDADFYDIVLNPRARLSPASFADVQRTMRVWADSVEQYPGAFGLHEDRISDLVTATLNATLPGAQREVYRRGGKSDIYILADVLAQGAGPARIFICESKWARSKKVVTEALDPQLFGYLNADDTAAILLLLLRQQDKRRAIRTCTGWLRSVPGRVRETGGEVEGWPVWRFHREGRHVDICLAFVHVPRT